MAKITIEIEDLDSGKVKVTATPTFEQMAKMELSGERITSAHGYAIYVLNQIRQESKRQEPTKLLIPKLTRY